MIYYATDEIQNITEASPSDRDRDERQSTKTKHDSLSFPYKAETNMHT